MGKLDSMMRCVQAKNLMNEKQYDKAVGVLEKIDAEKVKSITDLKIMGQIYLKTQHFEEAREVYFLLYDKIQSRGVLYQLIYLSIKCGLLDDAEDFYTEYKKLDKESVDCFILQYYLDKANGAERLTAIESLEKILSIDYMEEWAYELAKLYHKEGMEEKCVEECSKIILWFGEGIIVEKAMLLKLHYVDGLDISTPKAIQETSNLSQALKIAAAIARKNEMEANYQKATEEERIADIGTIAEIEMEADNETIDEIEMYADNETIDEIEMYADNETTAEILMYAEPEMEADNELIAHKQMEQSEENAYFKIDLDYQDEAKEFEDNSNDVIHKIEEELTYSQEIPHLAESSGNDPIEPNMDVKLDEKPAAIHSANTIEQKVDAMIDNIIREEKQRKEMPHFSVVGDDKEKMIAVIKYLVKRLCDNDVLPSPRIARITGGKVNVINLEDKRTQLEGSCLLIEGAGELTLPSIQSIYQITRRMRSSVVVILVDNESSMEKLLGKNRKLKSMINYELYV